MTDIVDRLNSGYPSLLAQRNGADEITLLRQQLAAANKRIRELEVESNSCGLLLLRAEGQLTAEREVSDKLEKALKQIEESDARAMYERCPDCDYTECRTTTRCRVVPVGPLGKIANLALAEVAAIRALPITTNTEGDQG